MTTSQPLRVLIAGGGTGGHLYPGLAVAQVLMRRRPGTVVTFAGTARGLEARVVPREGYALDLIRSAGLKGKSPVALLRGMALLPASALDAWRLLSRRRPDVVVGVGGYSSGHVVLLAALSRVPKLLLEQNAMPGFTNRILARVVRAAAVTYEASLPHFRGKGFVSGNPVRAEFFEAGDRGQREAGGEADRPVRVLVFGGSQGARAINAALVDAAPALASGEPGLSMTHQTGERDLDVVRDAYGTAGLDARVEAFLYEMAREMTEADVVVSRAGATTLAELAAVGRAAILVPFPGATDDHQRKNAEVLIRAGAAIVVDQRELTGAVLAEHIRALAADAGRRARMAAALRSFARPDAAERIVDRIVALAESGRP